MYIPTINFQLLLESIPFVLSGLPFTLGIACFAFIMGNIVGIGLMGAGFFAPKWGRSLIRLYLSFFRGVPGLVLLFLLYFALPYRLSALQASCICFTLTSSAFIGEIYRGSVQGVSHGQWDAASALGLSRKTILLKIILPQAFRISVPALGNVAMDLLKSTSLAAMITVPEIFQKAKIVGGREFDYLTMYILVALIYWGLCVGIGQIQAVIEKKLQPYAS